MHIMRANLRAIIIFMLDIITQLLCENDSDITKNSEIMGVHQVSIGSYATCTAVYIIASYLDVTMLSFISSHSYLTLCRKRYWSLVWTIPPRSCLIVEMIFRTSTSPVSSS